MHLSIVCVSDANLTPVSSRGSKNAKKGMCFDSLQAKIQERRSKRCSQLTSAACTNIRYFDKKRLWTPKAVLASVSCLADETSVKTAYSGSAYDFLLKKIRVPTKTSFAPFAPSSSSLPS
mmetsp:Transcript_55742/g.102182  ORF Transcript_55742/g.102182 Transcript_55742/m.102182 type:complete len:120 (-) Transcript_55742:5-364(-)